LKALLRRIIERFNLLQQRRGFRLIASAFAVVSCAIIFGLLIAQSLDIDRRRQSLSAALTGQNIENRDEHAVSLAEKGRVFLDGYEYGDQTLTERRDLIFDEQGNIPSPAALADMLLRMHPDYPASYRWLVEQPGTTWLLAFVVTLWLLLVIWLGELLTMIATLAVTAPLVVFCGLMGWSGAQWALGGIGVLTFTFVLLIRALQALLDRPTAVCAVAHTVLKEASRTRIGLVFIITLLCVLPLLPLGLDPASPLHFRIQTFMSRSLGLTFYVAAVMTLFLSCATVAFEIRDRQIWQIVAKPVSRFSYLLGKWVGVLAVNLAIMLIAAISIFTFIQYLRMQPVAQGIAGQEDAQQVRDSVLVARQGMRPDYPQLTDEQIRTRMDEYIRATPELAMQGEDLPPHVRRQIVVEMLRSFNAAMRSIPAQQEREYHFKGLQAAKSAGGNLTLRYQFHILRDDEHETFPAVFYFNQDPNLYVTRKYVPTMTHWLPVPAEFIRDDGTLTITVANILEPQANRPGGGSLNFEAEDFELLYRVGSFEANFLRAVLVDWTKLGFLGMLGICCATFLSFPVACLASFTIFAAGTVGPFLAQALREYYPPEFGKVDWSDAGMVITWLFKSFIRSIAVLVNWLLESFGQYRPTQSLIEGRYIPWPVVLGGMFKIGVVWSGLALLCGWLVMRSRQLAIYSGQG